MGLNDGEAPFGAVLLKNSTILAACRNRTGVEGNPTLHAEMAVIREACQKHETGVTVGATLMNSCEPCVMCLAASYYAGVTQIVYAATIEDAINHGSGDPLIKASWLNDVGALGLKLIGGVTRQEAVEVFSEYLKRYNRM